MRARGGFAVTDELLWKKSHTLVTDGHVHSGEFECQTLVSKAAPVRHTFGTRLALE
jgi:hypothetical protein